MKKTPSKFEAKKRSENDGPDYLVVDLAWGTLGLARVTTGRLPEGRQTSGQVNCGGLPEGRLSSCASGNWPGKFEKNVSCGRKFRER